MALFTDGLISSIEELKDHDTQLFDVANVEGIDVTRKMNLAQEEVGLELEAFLRKTSTARTCAGPGLERVVVTAPLKLWHTFRSLELVYRDAYHSQLNDRYAGRRDEYHEMAKWAREKLIQSGVGMVGDPIPQAAIPQVREVSGALAAGTYYVGVSWVSGTGEGACSLPAKITTGGGAIEVTPVGAPVNASGWMVYVGSDPGGLRRVSGVAVALGAPWTVTAVAGDGALAGRGQDPEYQQVVARLIERG
jgi:hypothetical protein